LTGDDAENSADPNANALRNAYRLAVLLQAQRIAAGAVITERPDPHIRLEGSGSHVTAHIEDSPACSRAQLVVGELMILVNACLAAWSAERNVPLLHRAQDVGLPREFAGVWSAPHDISRIVRALPPASLEIQPKRHAGLGLPAYATMTSPLRRYVDLVNQGQCIRSMREGRPVYDARELAALLPLIAARSDAVGQIQRMRPRYWKLLFFRQQGDKHWWNAVVTEENEAFAAISLPWAQMIVRGKRTLFDEKTYPGQNVLVRLGKACPLMGEIQILETREA
jgi:exoribonuclease-2